MKCVLRLSEVPLHLYQIIAGLELLRRNGKIDLDIECLSPASPYRLPYNMLEVDCGGRRIIFDMNDGYDNLFEAQGDYVGFYNKILDKCDILYKRSFNEELNNRLTDSGKIRKTPPNFLVTVKGNPAHIPMPCDPGYEKAKKIIRMLPFSQYYNGFIYEGNFKAKPFVNSEPKILFMARLWDPMGESEGRLNEEKSEERRRINESRANCIKRCRKEFGSRFFGGITYSDFAKKDYPELLLDNSKIGKKNTYLKLMKNFDIHIATSGLHKSTGWKFAEYIAASKAIVSEPLTYSSVGGLADKINYLSFTNEYDCCERIEELFDSQKRYKMMHANEKYYDEFMNCEKFAARALGIC